jgi:hypothetical protein
MSLEDRLPSDWRVAVAVVVVIGGAWFFVEARIAAAAETAVLPVETRQAVYEATTDGRLGRIEDDASRTREIAEKLLKDCYRRGGCQ